MKMDKNLHSNAVYTVVYLIHKVNAMKTQYLFSYYCVIGYPTWNMKVCKCVHWFQEWFHNSHPGKEQHWAHCAHYHISCISKIMQHALQTLHTPIALLMATKLLFFATHIVKAHTTQLLVAPINTTIYQWNLATLAIIIQDTTSP